MDHQQNSVSQEFRALHNNGNAPVFTGARVRFVLILLCFSLFVAVLFACGSMAVVNMRLFPALDDMGKENMTKSARLVDRALVMEAAQLTMVTDMLAVSIQPSGHDVLTSERLATRMQEADLEQLAVDAILVFQKNGTLAFERQQRAHYHDSHGQIEQQLRTLARQLALTGGSGSGFCMFGEGIPLNVAGRPLLNSVGENVGYITVMRLLSVADLHEMSRNTGVSLRVLLAESSQRAVSGHAPSTDMGRIVESVGDAYAFEVTAPVIHNMAPLMLRGETLSGTWQAYVMTRNGILNGILILSCIIFVVIYLLLEYVLLRPLEQLYAQLCRLESNTMVFGTVEVTGPAVFRRLGSLITQLAERLMRAEEKAADNAESSQSKSEFLAGIGKEMSAPIHQIEASLQRLRHNSACVHSDLQSLDNITAATSTLTEAFNYLMDFAMVDSGKVRLDSKPFFLDDALGQLATEYRKVCRNKKLELIFSVPPEIPQSVIGDRRRFTQVLRCLLDNACKFTDVGEVMLGCSMDNRAGNSVLLRFMVRDTGCGMTPEELATVFSPGMTYVDSPKEGTGLGVGLAIARSLVEMMGGEISVRSVHGRGSSFTVALQFKLEHALPGTSSVGSPAMRNMSVLVYEEDQTSRLVCYDMLKGLVLHIDVAETQEQVQDFLDHSCSGKAYDIVFIGVSVFATLHPEEAWCLARGNIVLPYNPIVIIAANSQVPAPEVLMRHGVDFFLQKPVMSHQLLQAVTDVMSHRQEQSSSEWRHTSFEGCTALVVEDNAINMELAVDLLQSMGLTVDKAVTGKDAVDKLFDSTELRQYHIVFMDILMPEMDGVSATKIIRQHPAYASLPIIAMTAHTQQESQDSYLQAGMNDCLPKPVDSRTLLALLKKYLPQHHATSPEGVAKGAYAPAGMSAGAVKDDDSPAVTGNFVLTFNSAPNQEEGRAHEDTVMQNDQRSPSDAQVEDPIETLNAEGFNTTGAMQMLNNNVKLYKTVLGSFFKQYNAGYPALEASVEAMTDFATLQREVHTIKGLAGTLGHEALQTTAAAFEQACKAPDQYAPDDLRKMGVDFLGLLRTVLDALQRVI